MDKNINAKESKKKQKTDSKIVLKTCFLKNW